MEQLQAVGAQLGIDATFIPMFALVVLLYAVLSVVYLKPFQHLLHDRKLKTEGAKAEAKELTAQAEKKMEQYKSAIKGAHDEARKIFAAIEDTAKKEESKLLSAASEKARGMIQAANADLEAQKKATLQQLMAEIPALAKGIVAKVLDQRA